MKAWLFALLIFMSGVAAADAQPRVLTCGGGNWANGIRIGGPTGSINMFPELDLPTTSTADADLTGDGVADIIAGAGAVNQAPLIRVFDGVTAQRLASWTTGEPAFTRVSVAAGDVDGDGFADIFVGSWGAWIGGNANNPPVVRIYSGRNGALLFTRTLDADRYRYGLEIAAGDVNGDGLADLVLAPGPGLESVVFAIDVASGDTLLQLTPYPGFGSGVNVAVGDVNGDGFADVITAPMALGGPHVRVFDGRTGDGLASFFAYAPSYTGGVLVTAGDFSGDGRVEIVTFGPDSGNLGHLAGVTIFDLAAGTNTVWPGTGRVCSTAIYENRLVADTPAQGTHTFGPFRVSGWGLQQGGTSGTGVETIDVFAAAPGGTPVHLGAATLGDARPDIAARFGDRYADSGFHFTVPRLPPGTYDIIVKGTSALTHLVNARTSLRVEVDGPAYQMVIDNPATGDGPSPFLVRGWALDLNAASGSGVDAVHVWALPAGSAGGVFCGAATLGLPRLDVGAVFGSQFDGAGFEASCDLPDGVYTIVAYKHSAVTHTFDEQAVVSYRAHGRGAAAMNLDILAVTGPDTAQTIELSGWALDGRNLAGSGIDAVHVWAFPVSGGTPVFVGVATPAIRTDVAQVFGTRFAAAGFTGTFAAPPSGTYDVAVYARSAFTGQFDQARVARVTVR